MTWILSIMNWKDQQYAMRKMWKILGHWKEGEVLQQASLPKELANTDGVESLPHVHTTKVERRKKVLWKDLSKKHQQLQQRIKNIYVANNCPRGITENQGYQNTDILSNDLAGTESILDNFENIYAINNIIITIGYSPLISNNPKDSFIIFKAKKSVKASNFR